MSKFQIFFDYGCPFCRKGCEALAGILPAYPGMEVEYVPIESHPRPEVHPPYTDLCVQAHYIALELKADMAAFGRALFAAACGKEDVEKPEVLAKILKGIVDTDRFLEILKSGKYASRVGENNDLAYEKESVWFVPAFRVPAPAPENAPKLDAQGGVGVSPEEIKNFLDHAAGI